MELKTHFEVKPGMRRLSDSRIAQWYTFDVFVSEFDLKNLNKVDQNGHTALDGAVANHDPETRFRTASWLLDHGADPNAGTDPDSTVLHILFDRKQHDPVRDAELLRRLLDAGADINKSIPKYGRPLAYLLEHFDPRYEDQRYFFDVLFSRPDLDLVARSKRTGESFAVNVLRMVRPKSDYFREVPDSPLEGMIREHLLAQGHDPEVVLAQVAGSGGGAS